ncbi:transcription factor IIIB subunit [Microdochium nivale]|nr:transcription factor IIIB subunit [Microdochium nivale]
MSSFIRSSKLNKPGTGFQIKPRGVAGGGSRISEALGQIEKTKNASAAASTAGKSSASSRAAADVVAAPRKSCPNPRCPNPSAPISEGYCTACGREIDGSNIVAEVQFGETSSGAAMVQGQFVGADQSTARSMGPGFRRMGGIADNRDRTARDAKHRMNELAHALSINSSTVDIAVQIFKLAMNENWIQGRGMEKVIVVCLYTACRREDRCQIMLIDFAEIVKINVYELGHVFKNLNDIYSFQNHNVRSIIPEDLMFRFADKLDFGEFTNNVAESAIKLCRRMGRDWMVMGRRPSGICGACLLMAARMWNFRRTVKEVVYVVKVTTATIEQRLDEFNVTESSGLTIEDFLNHEFLESRHDPPSFYKGSTEWKEKQDKDRTEQGRKRRLIEDISENILASARTSVSRDMPPPPVPRPEPDMSKLRQVSDFLPRSFDNSEGSELIAPFDPNSVPKPAPRITPAATDVAAGLAAEDPNAEDALDDLAHLHGEAPVEEEEEPEPEPQPTTGNRRGRKRKEKHEFSLNFDEEWERDEAELEKQINEVISDPHSDEHQRALASAAFRAKVKAEWARSLLPRVQVPDDETIGEHEFDDDPEVANCVLPPEQVKIKEVIWLNSNKAYLREQQEKIYRKQMEALGPPKRRRNRPKRPRMGEGQESPASTAEEAAMQVAERRGYSRRINYDAINMIFDKNKKRGPGSVASTVLDRDDLSRRTSRANSAVADTPPRPDESSRSADSNKNRKDQQPEKSASKDAAAAAAAGAEEEEEEEEDAAPYDDGEDLEHPGYDEEEDYEEGAGYWDT